MAEACFTARSSRRNQVKEEIAKLTLVTNGQGQYQHNNIVTLIKGVQRVLKSPFNPSNPGNGMVILLEKTSALSAVKSTDVATIKSVPAKLKVEAAAAITTTVTVPPEITTQVDAQDEANRLNVTNQAVIGSKKGTAAAFTELVGSDITDAVLRTANGKDFKLINDYMLDKILVAIISGADRPAMTASKILSSV